MKWLLLILITILYAGLAKPVKAVETSGSTGLYYEGKASWYGEDKSTCVGCSASRTMANGQRFDEAALTAACPRRVKLGQKLLVTYKGNGVRVVCTDRGGFEGKLGRVIDLSKAAFAQLAPVSKGIIKVQILEVD